MGALPSLVDPRDVALAKFAPYLYYVDKTGRNTDVDAATAPEDIWHGGGLYTGFNAVAAETVTVVSSSANDTAAGTGMRSVTLIGLDGDGTLKQETVVLNGITPVTSSMSWLRINRAYIATAGSGGTNAGTITIAQSVTTANVFAVMPPGFGQSQQACYTVAAGYKSLIVNLQVAAYNNAGSAQEITVVLATRDSGTGAWRARSTFVVSNTVPVRNEYVGGIQAQPLTDITVRALSATGDNLTVVTRFEMFVIKS